MQEKNIIHNLLINSSGAGKHTLMASCQDRILARQDAIDTLFSVMLLIYAFFRMSA